MDQKLRYQKLWTAEVRLTQEDEKLKQLVGEYGIPQWTQVAKELNKLLSINRKPKQCRERFLNYLDPQIIDNQWSAEDIQRLFDAQIVLGSDWQELWKLFPGKSKTPLKTSIMPLCVEILEGLIRREAAGTKFTSH